METHYSLTKDSPYPILHISVPPKGQGEHEVMEILMEEDIWVSANSPWTLG